MSREMKDSGVAWIGEMPSEWSLIRFKDKYINKKEIAGEAADGYERLALTLNGVIKRAKDDSEGLQPKEFNGYQIIRKNDFVFKMIDLQNISTSRVGLSLFEGLVSPAYIRFSSRNKHQNNKYMYYYLMSLYYNCVYNNMAGDGVRSALNAKDLGQIACPAPNEEESEQIVAFIENKNREIEKLLENQNNQIEKLKVYKQSLITETVIQGLNENVNTKDSEIDWIGRIPDHWGIARVRNYGILQNGISKGGEAFGSGYPFVSYGDVYRNFELPNEVNGLIETTEKEQEIYSVEKGDIFFTRTSETIEEVGFSCVCNETIPKATFAGFLIRLRPFNDMLDTAYAKYYFRGTHIRKYLVKEMNLVTRASLGQNLLKSMTILVPPKDEQIEIAKYLDEKCSKIDSLIAIKQQKIEKLNQYKKSIIYEYVTGKKEA